MSTLMEPPPFQESARCDVCNCSFNTFRRRHHCRCCGRTLCREHSSDQMALPQFGIYTSVRVCSDCFNNSSRHGGDPPPTYESVVNATTEEVSKLNLGIKIDRKPDSGASYSLVVPDCKCGMPLCICVAPTPDPAPVQKTSNFSHPNPRQKKTVSSSRTSNTVSNSGTSSNTKQSSFFNSGQTSDSGTEKSHAHYESNGEGLREAIKNDDIGAVKKLLSEGVDANYCDKQGMTLLHLAALFNRTEISFVLMDYGASTDSKNAQGETPVDIAPVMLQHKMRQKINGTA